MKSIIVAAALLIIANHICGMDIVSCNPTKEPTNHYFEHILSTITSQATTCTLSLSQATDPKLRDLIHDMVRENNSRLENSKHYLPELNITSEPAHSEDSNSIDRMPYVSHWKHSSCDHGVVVRKFKIPHKHLKFSGEPTQTFTHFIIGIPTKTHNGDILLQEKDALQKYGHALYLYKRYRLALKKQFGQQYLTALTTLADCHHSLLQNINVHVDESKKLLAIGQEYDLFKVQDLTKCYTTTLQDILEYTSNYMVTLSTVIKECHKEIVQQSTRIQLKDLDLVNFCDWHAATRYGSDYKNKYITVLENPCINWGKDASNCSHELRCLTLFVYVHMHK